ncbi:MAG TPA: hypothetical protein VGD74_00790, partial [Vulgatibacter sp.]
MNDDRRSGRAAASVTALRERSIGPGMPAVSSGLRSAPIGFTTGPRAIAPSFAAWAAKAIARSFAAWAAKAIARSFAAWAAKAITLSFAAWA